MATPNALAVQVKLIFVEAATGAPLADEDPRFFDAPCLYCGPHPYVSRSHGHFLCLGCIDEHYGEGA